MTNADDIVSFQGSYKDSVIDKDKYHNHGLTKLEYFAAMAMQGLLSNAGASQIKDSKDIARVSVIVSKALIAELNK